MRIDSVKIKLLMAEQDLTQYALAVLCGVSKQNINQTLARGTCSTTKVVKISKALGVDAREIIKEE